MKNIQTIALLLIIFSFSGTAWSNSFSAPSINSDGWSSQEYLQQVYQYNSYAIDQLEKVLRSEKKRPYRIGAQLKEVDTPMLVVKLNSLNYLLQRHSQPEASFIYQPLLENLTLNSQELLKQSQSFILNLSDVFKKYPSLTLDEYEHTSAIGWFDEPATPIVIYQQLLHIEKYLYGIKTVINPEGVYEIILSTHNIIFDSCPNNAIKQTPLVMGKRPKDVYAKLFEYLRLITDYTQFTMPEHGSIHVLPSDVFDTALIAMVYSRKINEASSLKINKTNTYSKRPDYITPSHVYQAVTQNIQLLECITDAS